MHALLDLTSSACTLICALCMDRALSSTLLEGKPQLHDLQLATSPASTQEFRLDGPHIAQAVIPATPARGVISEEVDIALSVLLSLVLIALALWLTCPDYQEIYRQAGLK